MEKFGGLLGENHAYGFIHANGLEAIGKVFEMTFDVIVGNPPYQMTGGGGGSNDTPVYNLFVEQAIELAPKYVAMITPSRWFAGGRGLDSYREKMLSDRRLKVIVDFPKASEIFPQVEIKGGVSYFLWDAGHDGTCEVTIVRDGVRQGPTSRNLDEFDVFVRDSIALNILHKVMAAAQPSFVEIYTADTPFGFASNFSGYSAKPTNGSIPLIANRQGKRIDGFVARSSVAKNSHLIDSWKVLIPEAGSDGGQRLPDTVLGSPIVASPPSVCTQTYLFAYLDTEADAKSVESYVRTRFFRFLVSLRKISQHAYRSTYEWVPQQSWDRNWTDDELYSKYGFTQEERAYIAEMVKELPQP
jgi:site-specific DNA-methyltransferase (adenine-specific)